MKGEDLPEDGVFNFLYFIKLKDYIDKFNQRGLCELSEIAEIISTVIKRKGFQVVYLFDCKKSQGPWMNFQGTKVSCARRLFSKMNFVTCRSTHNSSCYRIES